eukprot:GILK01012299.1.p1 GENE.GILK01012299.1~~GILK01012299.1.p1  ORF type:complete len:167 (+),score=3.46 GILK01012299.1:52-501(+)
MDKVENVAGRCDQATENFSNSLDAPLAPVSQMLMKMSDKLYVSGTAKSGAWNTECWECYLNPASCLATYFCPCLQFGMTAQKDGHGTAGPKCCLCWCCAPCLCLPCNQRTAIRKKHNIPGSVAEDWLCTIFCSLCSQAQEARHVYNLGK